MDKEEAQWLLTQIDRIVSDRIEGSITTLRSEMRSFHDETLSRFDEIYRRLDRLESEYQALTAAVKRLESEHHALSAAVKRLESETQALTSAVNRLEIAFAEDRAARMDIQSKIEKLKVQVAELQEEIARLEADSHDA